MMTDDQQLAAARTPRDIVRLYRPGWDDDQVDEQLWERTCFPMGGLSEWWHQLDQQLASSRRRWPQRFWRTTTSDGTSWWRRRSAWPLRTRGSRTPSMPTDAGVDDLRWLAQIVVLGFFGTLVDLAGLITLAWQHQFQALFSMTFALFLMLGASLRMAYMLGKEQILKL